MFSRPIPDPRGETQASTPGFQLSLQALLFPLGFLDGEASVNDFPLRFLFLYHLRFLFLYVAGDRSSILILFLSRRMKDSSFTKFLVFL
jgi:hypothetical protein